MTKTYILHHNDPDGYGAAIAAYQKFGDSATYIEVDYTLPMPELEDGSDVYILDFSYKRPVLDALIARMNSVLIIDHHKSAMEDLTGHPNAIFDMKRSGAGLAWDYFVGGHRPIFIDYIEDQDLLRYLLVESKLVSLYINQLDLTIQSFLSVLHSFDIHEALVTGRIIQKSIDHDWDLVKGNVIRLNIDDSYHVLALNSSLKFNEFGEKLLKLNEEKYNNVFDFTAIFYYINENKIKFSLRSRIDGIDVSNIAWRFKGGGHHIAAGFELDAKLFDTEMKSPHYHESLEAWLASDDYKEHEKYIDRLCTETDV